MSTKQDKKFWNEKIEALPREELENSTSGNLETIEILH